MENVLLIDIGNSNIVIGVMAHGAVMHTARIDTMPEEQPEGCTARLSALWAQWPEEWRQVEGGMLSSVVPQQTAVMREAVKRVLGIGLMVLGHDQVRIDMPMAVDHPEAVGHDRIADAVGAIAHYGAPLMVVDMGTATTVNVVDGEGRFIGGMIAPGMRTAFDALCNKASQLSQIPLQLPGQLIGRNTTECMQSGLLHGHAAMIDGLAHRIAHDLGTQPRIVLTGGLARLIVGAISHPAIYDEHLLLKGLYHLYVNNRDTNTKV